MAEAKSMAVKFKDPGLSNLTEPVGAAYSQADDQSSQTVSIVSAAKPKAGSSSAAKKYDFFKAYEYLLSYLIKRGIPHDSYRMRCVVKHLMTHPQGASFNRRHNEVFAQEARILRDFGLILSKTNTTKHPAQRASGRVIRKIQEVFYTRAIQEHFDWVEWMEMPDLMWTCLPMPLELKIHVYQLPLGLLDQMIKECLQVRTANRLEGQVENANLEANFMFLSRIRTMTLERNISDGVSLENGSRVLHEFASYKTGRYREHFELSKVLFSTPSVHKLVKIQTDHRFFSKKAQDEMRSV